MRGFQGFVPIAGKIIEAQLVTHDKENVPWSGGYWHIVHKEEILIFLLPGIGSPESRRQQMLCMSDLYFTYAGTNVKYSSKSRKPDQNMASQKPDPQITPAPLSVSQWFNTDTEIRLADLRGKVILLEAFQMLCPGCVSHGLPQAQSVHETFSDQDLVVLGIHTVFEHHSAMTPVSLEAFLFEYKITFPVGVDKKTEHDIPETMAAYQMQGTPSTILIDRQGHLRLQYFGRIPDLQLGFHLATLLAENTPHTADSNSQNEEPSQPGCDENGCVIP